ncbi:hypothetical protein POTOM_030244 [Populus tomentosa]|uniref:Uncharacterized protein n=1 Tax=Populus tomentosa TaxID=118781 RepID=A0A8X8CTS1_POPTO|nr:hypothetical protein POTOM_030244 [Populus tomentosa]
MLSLGTSKGILEIAKFGVYVTVPIVLMYSFASNTSNLQKFMGNFLRVDKCGRTLDASWMVHAVPKALSEHNSEMKSMIPGLHHILDIIVF